MVRIFENPDNRKQEKIDVDTSVCVFFLGPIYLAIKGLWIHALVWLAVVAPLVAVFGSVGFLLSVPVLAIVYATTIQSILIKKYVRQGWSEVTKKISTPYEVLQAKLYEESINSTYASFTHASTVQPAATGRACHFCTAAVSLDAVTCHHCHSDLSAEVAVA